MYRFKMVVGGEPFEFNWSRAKTDFDRMYQCQAIEEAIDRGQITDVASVDSDGRVLRRMSPGEIKSFCALERKDIQTKTQMSGKRRGPKRTNDDYNISTVRKRNR